jgi:beta-galactosidase
VTKPEFVRALSRRAFLQGTSLGLTLSWGQVPVYAQLFGENHQVFKSHSRVGSDFIYGAQFYHPRSEPRPDQFRSMIEAIANKYEFNIIRIFPPWDYYNPRPSEFKFDDLKQLLDICDEFGLRVLMTLILESAPYWLEQAHPETRLVNAKGEAMHLQGNGGRYTGGAPGLCFDWEVVREAAALFVHELARISAPHPSLYAYDIWNEPCLVDPGYQGLGDTTAVPVSEQLFCYCDRTTTKFQNWLQTRYGTLDRLNTAWIRSYSDWKAIDPPRSLINMYADWLDWFHFIEECTTEQMKFRAKAVRDVDPNHVLESHTNYTGALPTDAVALSGVQNWRLAEVVDVFGCSLYPNLVGATLEQSAATLDLVRSCAMGKDFWVTEMPGNHFDIGYWRSGPTPPKALRVLNWLAIAGGAKAIIYWQYLTEGLGVEASGFGLVARNGAPTERVEEAARANRLIQARWEVLKNYRPDSQVAIVFDQDNALLTFAGNAKETPSTQSVAGYHKAFWNLDFGVDFIEPSSIPNASYKVLVLPWHLIGKKATCESLRRYVEQGGTLILETAFSRFDEHYSFNPVIPGHGLDEVFGYREQDSIVVEDAKVPIEALDQAPSGPSPCDAEIRFSQPIAVKVKAHTYLTPIEVLSAIPIATCHQWTVASMKQVGKGKVYYFGTNFGASIFAGDPGGIELLRATVSNVVRPLVTSSGAIRPRLIRSSARGLLTVFNDTDAHQKATITVPAEYKRATDVYSGERITINKNEFVIRIPFKDVAVFDLE